MHELDTDAVVMTHTCRGSEPGSLISSLYLSHYIYEGHPFRNVSTVCTHAERRGWDLMIKASSCCIYHKGGSNNTVLRFVYKPVLRRETPATH